MLSKNHDLQQLLFGDVVYNDDLCKYLNLQYNAKENDDFQKCKNIQNLRRSLKHKRYRIYW